MPTIIRFFALVASVLVFCFAGTAGAAIITIDFEADSTGYKSNGFTPSGVSGVSFSDSVGAELNIFNFGAQGDGQSLAVDTGLDGSVLEIALSFSADFISLDFGNDDPTITNPGDLAVLTAYLGASPVGQTVLLLNRDDLMNQTISFGSVGGGLLFDNLTFAFTDPSQSPFTGGGAVNVGATEIVDNIQINQVARVPEPGTLALLGMGIAVIGLYRRIKNTAPDDGLN